MRKPEIRLGLICLGLTGRDHLRVLAMMKSESQGYVGDCEQEFTERLANKHDIPGVIYIRTRLRDIKTLVIFRLTVNHAETFRWAAKNGLKNILFENPLALADAELLTNTAKELNLNVQVGLIERFNPAVQRLKQVLDASGRMINVILGSRSSSVHGLLMWMWSPI